ncbi:MAG: BrnT family toxin [Anaerolineales bacterium]|nr:BrnT family toxin [Anaerolineales bacterium]
MQYTFDWDPHKAATNAQKHKITFRQAATVFHDPQQLSLYDETHSEDEDRWITLGIAQTGGLLVVIHTFEQLDAENVRIRMISARKATPSEVAQYQEVNQ